MNRIIAAMLAAGVCASAQAQTGAALAGSPFTLEQALTAARATSPALEASRSGVTAAEAQRTVAGLRPNPSLDTMTENVTGSGMYSGLRSSETTIAMAIPVELGGKRSARIAVASAQLGRASLDAVIAQADLRLRVTQAYNEAVAAERRAGTAHDQVEIAEQGLRAARARVSAGRASPLEEQRAELVRLNAAGAADRADRSIKLAFDNLWRLTGQAASTLDEIWFDRIGSTGPTRPIDTAATLAAAAAQADLATASAQVRLARSQRVPDVTFTAGAKRLQASSDTAAVFGVSVPLPLFNNGRASFDLASAQRQQADAQRRVALLDADREIASAQAELANAATTARNAAGPALAAATEAARIARIGYREGKFGQLDLLEAERALSDTKATAIDALAAYHDTQARLERLVTPAPESTKDAR